MLQHSWWHRDAAAERPGLDRGRLHGERASIRPQDQRLAPGRLNEHRPRASHRGASAGRAGDGPLESAEVYDSDKDIWLPLRPLITPRSEPTGTSLQDGSVLVVGGLSIGGIPLATTEL